MLTIAITFPAGCYHATPWDRHVNEAAVAWPPDPWRLSRAFIATWHRKLDQRFSRDLLRSVLEKLASSAPVYRLPAAVHFHTRHYMPQEEMGEKRMYFDHGKRRICMVKNPNTKKFNSDVSLIFDAFARVEPDDPLVVCWPELNLSKGEATLLDELLNVIGYLGRAESWVDAHRLYDWDLNRVNCKPNNAMNIETGEMVSEIVTLLAPMKPNEYSEMRHSMLSTSAERNKKERQAIDATLPADWLKALSLDTSDLQRAGWSKPPAARKVLYVRLPHALSPRSSVVRRARTVEKPVTTVRLTLFGKPLPRIEDAVRVGEWVRMAAMSRAKHSVGEDRIPSAISGHNLPRSNRHEHTFWLPEDADNDGRVDHLLIHAPGGFNAQCQSILTGITRLWSREGAEYKVFFEAKGGVELFIDISPLVGNSATWRSISPYLYPWHVKKGFGVGEQIRRECRERGLQEPASIELVTEVEVAPGNVRRPVHFRRFRTKRGLIQPDTHGRFLQLVFPGPISGPLALGYGCHFGLGLFKPCVAEAT